MVHFVLHGFACACLSARRETSDIYVLKPLLSGAEPCVTFSLHTSPVKFLSFSPATGLCFSADDNGGLELWDPLSGKRATKKDADAVVSFEFKSETDLFELQKVVAAILKCT